VTGFMRKDVTGARGRNGRDGLDKENKARVRRRRPAACFLALLALAAVFAVLAAGYFLLKDRLFPPALSLPEGAKVRAAWRMEAEGPFRIGDLIPVSLEIEGVKGVEVRQLPLSAADLGGLELVEEERPVTRARKGGWYRRTRYVFTAWRTGDYRLAAGNITYYTADSEEAKVTVAPLDLTVVSVLPVDLGQEEIAGLNIKEDKGPVGLPPDYRTLVIALVTGAFLVLLFLLLRRFVGRRGKNGEEAAEELPPPEPAHVIARHRLAALRAADLLAAGKIKEYYSELSFCLREYLENRYHLPALEMTSGEILKSPVRAGLPLAQQAALAEVLEVADLVKFAKHRPAVEAATTHFTLVEEFVEATKEEPPAEEALPEEETLTPDGGTLQAEKETPPEKKGTLPVEEDLPVKEETRPAEEKTQQVKEKTQPAEEKIQPVKEKIQPTEGKTLPGEGESSS
jgi:hypothetical protein